MKRKRLELQDFFLRNNIPTQDNFHDFIDSGFNQLDDGLIKTEGGPIALQAQGDRKEILHLYKTSITPDQVPAWKINLNPSATASGLNIAGTADASRLFIRDDGNVGIGTDSPAAKLQVKDGVIMPASGNGVNAGILFPAHPLAVSGEAAYIRYYAVTYIPSIYKFDPSPKTVLINTVLEIGAGNQPRDHIALMTAGNIGIGTTAPDRRLTIQASAGTNEILSIKNNQGVTKWHINLIGGGLNIAESGVADYRFFVKEGGNIGIGTSTPVAKLDIYGSVMQGVTDFYSYLAAPVDLGGRTQIGVNNIDRKYPGIGTISGDTMPISIKASDRIVAKEFDATSDERIKKDFVKSNPNQSLHILNQIPIMNFVYKDEIQYGYAVHTGVIAQAVEQVLPDAVSVHPDFIPDIYSLPHSVVIEEQVLTITMKEPHHLNTGDIVRLITSSGSKEVTVTKTTGTSFFADGWNQEQSQIFVYGKKVKDFRTVNYNSIFCLGISAIQELYKQIQQLKEELSSLKEAAAGQLVTG